MKPDSEKKFLTVFIVAVLILTTASYFVIFRMELALAEQLQEEALRAQETIEEEEPEEEEPELVIPDWITEDYIPVNEYSRPGTELTEVNAVVVHYTGNPGTTAANHRSYYEYLKTTKEASVSSHFVVGLEGEIILCVPMDEIAYASNHRNSDTISIEVCYVNKDGSFNDVTYDAVVKLSAWLCEVYGLNKEGVIRHYDVTGKECPKYYVDNEDKWFQFQDDVAALLPEDGKENG